MKITKIIYGGIAGGVTFFLLGWLVYGILLMDYMTANYNMCASRGEDMIWWSLILSNLALGFLFSIVFSLSNTKGLAKGAILGGTIGLLMAVNMDLANYSMSTVFLNCTAVTVDIIVFTVMSVIIGAVVTLVMGSGKKDS